MTDLIARLDAAAGGSRELESIIHVEPENTDRMLSVADSGLEK